jgi:hypothetical protein
VGGTELRWWEQVLLGLKKSTEKHQKTANRTITGGDEPIKNVLLSIPHDKLWEDLE